MKRKKLAALAALFSAGAIVGLASCNNVEIPGVSQTTPAGSSQGGSATPTPTPAPTPTPTPTPTPVVKAPIELNGQKYETIQKALAAIPTDSKDTYTIKLQKGTYTENGLSYKGSATIKISGDTNTKYGTDVIIKGHGSDMSKMRARELLEIQGSGNIILENLTLESDWSRADHKGGVQAEVLGTDTTGNTVAYNCSFKSHQDTLRTAGKAWFYGCYIEGDVDFIWMEQAGSVALYEKCEIVSLYDENATTHNSYLTAPRMAVSTKAGKGLVIYNSTVKESAEAKEKGQLTYLARSPWNEGYYNQVAYINTTINDVEVEANNDSKSQNAPWYGEQIATDYAKTVIGWKMDKATATSLGYEGNNDILSDDVVAKEYNGRKAILNRIYNTGKGKYEADVNKWDIDSLITENGWAVDADASKVILDGESTVSSTIYEFDGSVDQSSLCNGFDKQDGKSHYVGQAGSTITIPVAGKSYVEIYGYYAGTAEVKAGSQGEGIVFFNNGSTSSSLEQDYIVYDESSTSVVIKALATTYITRIVVTPDSTIEKKNVESIDITASSKNYIVGVALNLSAKVLSSDATNRCVKWSSSDTTIGEVDEYTGKVTFKKAGTVTFTATALDGSEVSSSITCKAISADWTIAEWYTTDNNLAAEENANGISYFNPNSSVNKDLKTTIEYRNAAGTTYTTGYGLKLNSSGKLSISTVKPATLTVVVYKLGSLATDTPKVTNGTATATATVTDDTNFITYVYRLDEIGTWDITRGGGSESYPIIYASVVCDKEEIKETTGFTFKGTTYQGTNVKNCNSKDTILLDGSKAKYENVTFEGCKSNNANNWLKFNAGSTITFDVTKACKLNICFYQGKNNATVKLGEAVITTSTSADAANDQTKYEYDITGSGTITISATNTDNSSYYIGYFEIIME